MIRKASLLFTSVISFAVAFSQTPPPTNLTNLPKIIPQSPNTASFKKFGDIPVSYYTGTPDISIPLYTVSVDNVSVPVSISYHASGIKVADEAGRVGLGWSLIAGSSITRTIRGEDDFNHRLSSTFSYHSTSNPAPEIIKKGKNFQELYPILNDDHGLVEAWKSKIYPGTDMSTAYGTIELYDMEPDLYQFNFPGYSGKFIMKHNKEVVLEKNSKILIQCVGTNADSWQVTAPDGTKYYFEQPETFKDDDPVIIYRKTAWHLTKIITPENNQILFNYTVQGSLAQIVGNVSEYRSEGTTLSCTSNPDISYTLTNTGGKEYQVPILNEILFDNGKVSFLYDNIRDDIYDSKLTQVDIYLKEGASYTKIKSWQFNYEYFVGNEDVSFNIAISGLPTDHYHKRLKLKSLVEKGKDGTTLPPYEFTYYNETGSAPSKASFARDHWGYYNGKLGKTHLIPEFTGVHVLSSDIGKMDASRSAGKDNVTLFALKSIKYPTGGRTEFDFEAHTYDQLNSGVALGGAGDERETEPWLQSKNYNGNVYNQYQPLAADLPNKLMDLNDMIIVQDPQTGGYTGSNVTMSVFIMYSGSPQSLCPPPGTGVNNFNILLCKEDGSPAVAGSSAFSPFDYASANPGGLATCVGSSGNYIGVQFDNTYYLTPGKYYLRVYINSAINYISVVSVGLNYIHYKQPQVNSLFGLPILNAGYGGGLRIKKIADYDQSGNSTGIRKFDYTYTDGQSILHSSGRRMLEPQYSYFEEVVGSGCTYGQRLMRVSDSYLPLGASSGSPICYDQVIVYYGENGENGKSEYFYSNTTPNPLSYSDNSTLAPSGTLPPEWPAGWGIWQSPLSNPLPKIPSFAITSFPSNGNLLKTIDYKFNGSYQKLKEEENVYTDFMSGQDIYWWGVNQIPRKLFINNNAVSVGGYMYYWGLSSWRKNYPALTASRIELTSKTTRVYDPADINKLVQTTQLFYYDNSTHLQLLKQETYNSKEELLKTEYKYPHDFAVPSNVYNDMVTRNMVSPVIEQKNYNGTQFLQSVKTNYKLWPGTNNLIEPETVETKTGTATTEIRIRYNAYDHTGNVMSVSKEMDVKNIYIWDYFRAYPIAQVIHSSLDTVAYTSFEADGKGNWSFSGTPSVDPTAPTGKKSYNLASGSITKSGLITTGTYIVSYWSTGGSKNVNGTTATTIRTVNTWTCYEHKVVNPAGGLITISGTGSIDELRLYPNGALMTSYTYEPLTGMTTQNDPNNRISYYEYDVFGRLQHVRDQVKNIAKKVDYKYQSFLHNNPVWQNTSAPLRCKQSGGQNTGEQEQEQIDINPNSPTYNQTQWVIVGINTTVCPPPAPPVTVQGYNVYSVQYKVKFTNEATSNQYTFDLNPNTFSEQTLGQVPSGTYTVQFYVWMAGPVNATFYVNGYTQYGTGATFYGISVNTLTVAKMY